MMSLSSIRKVHLESVSLPVVPRAQNDFPLPDGPLPPQFPDATPMLPQINCRPDRARKSTSARQHDPRGKICIPESVRKRGIGTNNWSRGTQSARLDKPTPANVQEPMKIPPLAYTANCMPKDNWYEGTKRSKPRPHIKPRRRLVTPVRNLSGIPLRYQTNTAVSSHKQRSKLVPVAPRGPTMTFRMAASSPARAAHVTRVPDLWDPVQDGQQLIRHELLHGTQERTTLRLKQALLAEQLTKPTPMPKPIDPFMIGFDDLDGPQPAEDEWDEWDDALLDGELMYKPPTHTDESTSADDDERKKHRDVVDLSTTIEGASIKILAPAIPSVTETTTVQFSSTVLRELAVVLMDEATEIQRTKLLDDPKEPPSTASILKMRQAVRHDFAHEIGLADPQRAVVGLHMNFEREKLQQSALDVSQGPHSELTLSEVMRETALETLQQLAQRKEEEQKRIRDQTYWEQRTKEKQDNNEKEPIQKCLLASAANDQQVAPLLASISEKELMKTAQSRALASGNASPRRDKRTVTTAHAIGSTITTVASTLAQTKTRELTQLNLQHKRAVKQQEQAHRLRNRKKGNKRSGKGKSAKFKSSAARTDSGGLPSHRSPVPSQILRQQQLDRENQDISFLKLMDEQKSLTSMEMAACTDFDRFHKRQAILHDLSILSRILGVEEPVRPKLKRIQRDSVPSSPVSPRRKSLIIDSTDTSAPQPPASTRHTIATQSPPPLKSPVQPPSPTSKSFGKGKETAIRNAMQEAASESRAQTELEKQSYQMKTTDAMYKERFGKKLTAKALAKLDGEQLLAVQRVALELAQQLELLQEELIPVPNSTQEMVIARNDERRVASPSLPNRYVRPISPRPTSPYQSAKDHFYKQIRKGTELDSSSSSAFSPQPANSDRQVITPTQSFMRACQQQFLLPDPIVCALVEATKGSHGHCLHLNHYSVGDRYANSLASAIKQCQPGSLTSILLADNRLSDTGAQDILNAIDPSTILRLDFSHNNCFQAPNFRVKAEPVVQFTVTNLASFNDPQAVKSGLRELKPDLRYHNAPKALPALLNLVQRTSSLTELNLENTKVGDACVQQLCQAMATTQTITALNLNRCDIKQTAVASLSDFVAINKNLRTLLLAYNNIGMEQHAHRRLGSGTTVSGETRTVGKGIVDLILALEVQKNVQVLNISWNSIGSFRGANTVPAVTALTDYIESVSSSKLQHLDLSHNNFTSSDTFLFAQGLSSNHTLFSLGFDGNNGSIDSKGFLTALDSDGRPWKPAPEVVDVGDDVGSEQAVDTDTSNIDTADGESSVPLLVGDRSLPAPVGQYEQKPSVSAETLSAAHYEFQLQSKQHEGAGRLSAHTEAHSAGPDWVLDGWLPHRFEYTVGVSGPPAPIVNGVSNLTIHLSCDHYKPELMMKLKAAPGNESDQTQLYFVDRVVPPGRVWYYFSHGGQGRRWIAFDHAEGQLPLGAGPTSYANYIDPHLHRHHPEQVGADLRPGIKLGILAARADEDEPVVTNKSNHQRVTFVNIDANNTTESKRAALRQKLFNKTNQRKFKQLDDISPQLMHRGSFTRSGLSTHKFLADLAQDKRQMQLHTVPDKQDGTEATRGMQDPGDMAAFQEVLGTLCAGWLYMGYRPRVACGKIPYVVEDEPEDAWDLRSSIFSTRPFESDSHAFFDGQDTLDAAFEQDWAHTKIYRVVKDEDEREAVKMALKEVYGKIVSIFKYYAASTKGALQAFFVPLLTFSTMMQECKVVDKLLTSQHLDTIFIATNVTLTPMPNNDDNAIERFEMLEALVRVAMKKYMDTYECPTASDAVKRLLHEHFLKFAQRADLNEFRAERFYTQSCEQVLKPHMKALSIIFEGYCSLPARKLGAQKSALYMPIKDYLRIFMDIGYLNDQFVAKSVKLSFVTCKLMYEDEMADERYKLLTFMDFMEAICRVVDLKYIHIDERNPFNNWDSGYPGSKPSKRKQSQSKLKTKEQLDMERREEIEFNRDKRPWPKRLETLLVHFIGLCRLKTCNHEVSEKLRSKRNLAPSLYKMMMEKGLARKESIGISPRRKRSQNSSELDKRRKAAEISMEALVDGKLSKKKRRLSRFKARQTTGGLVSRPNEIATRKSSKEMLDHNGDAMDDGLAAAMRLAKQTVLARRASQEEQQRASFETNKSEKGGVRGGI